MSDSSDCKPVLGLYMRQGGMAGCANAGASMAAQDTSAVPGATHTALLPSSSNVYGGHAQVHTTVCPDDLSKV